MSQEKTTVDLLTSRSQWSWKVKVARGLWMPFKILVALPGPRFLSPVRIFFLRSFGAKIGRQVLVSGGVKIWCPWNLSIGDFSAVGLDVEIYNFAQVTIGTQSVISQYAYLCTASHRYQMTNMALYFEPITIGNQVWIAARAFIGPNVTMAEGSVAGAYSVVTRSVDPWTVVAGNPAKFIKTRTLSSPETPR